MASGMYFETAPYEELCGCVTVSTTSKERDRLKKLAKIDTDSHESYLVSLFNKKRDRSYLAGCRNCDSGIMRDR